MATDDDKLDQAKARLEKAKRLKDDLSGSLMSGRLAARTETRVRVQKHQVDENADADAASIPKPTGPRPAQPPTTARRKAPGAQKPTLKKKAPPKPVRKAPPKKGEKRVAWDPRRLKQFITGVITLGELEGISKKEQYEMAELGHQALKAGRVEDAHRVFSGLVTLDPRDAYFHLALGSAAQQLENLEEAEAAYSASLEIDPFSPHALANRGEVRMLLGRMVDGAKDLLRALEEDPDCTQEATRRARATISVVMDQLDGAKKKKAAPRPRGRGRARGRGPRPRGRPSGPRRPGRPRRK